MRPDEESQGPVIRDRRRIDPATGQGRDPGESGPRRGSAQAGTQPRPGRHSVSRPGGMTSGPGASSPADGAAARGTADSGQAADDQPGATEGEASSATMAPPATGMAQEGANA